MIFPNTPSHNLAYMLNPLNKALNLGLGGLAIAILSTPVNASTIIWDYSPATTNTTGEGTPSSFVNSSTFVNFAEMVSFSVPQILTGMDIYSNELFSTVGNNVTIRIRLDNSGTPGTLIHDFNETITIIDDEGIGEWESVSRKFVAFSTPVTLAADTTYWIGMSREGSSSQPSGQLGQAFLDTDPGDGRVAQFLGTDFNRFQALNGDMAFRLHGRAVPEPLTILGAMTAAGMGAFFKSKTKKR